ncbi:aldo/keto reductase [Domibacillus epiphyticus]|uniref:Oxidoreductase n=1 Tax=Domibacillus epiphyticus TaxID=1714355 RepID=A0A1V2A532_9BACI|nr:aldo/keto reductase [Domibacillus epiphyticus]OMP65914.1 oxidoreductase [Domibacillus epiphyticus]
MNTRELGNSGIFVSELGLGCMSIGTEERHAESILHTALDEGITYFDTADLYDFGVNEQLVGKTLKQVREKVVIASKAGNRWTDSKDSWTWDASKAYIKEAAKQSLKRLDTEYIDLYQLHGGTLDDPIDETIEAFEELKSEGFIRAYGISSIRPTVINQYVKRSSISSVMMQYSILDRRPEFQALPILAENGVSVVARGPVSFGLLSTNWREKLQKAAKKGLKWYSEKELSTVLTTIENSLAPDRTLNGLAFRYVLHHPAAAAVVAGASSVDQLRENARAVREAALTEEEYKWIQDTAIKADYDAHRL